jgi:hypothetical protein
VDVEELERIAVNIARAAVPSTESLEVGARLAMQAAAMEAESADPLGLGRVDPRGLALVRGTYPHPSQTVFAKCELAEGVSCSKV